MNRGANALLADGARLLARRKAVVGWLLLAYVGFGFAGFIGVTAALGPTLNTSLYSERLAGGFDAFAFLELIGRPDVPVAALAARSLASAVALALLLWFCNAGILAEFLSAEKLGAERFFQFCGAFWWRFVRLILLTWVMLLPALGILAGIRSALVDAADRSWHVRLPFATFVAVTAVQIVVAFLLRAWFDVAELDLIHCDRRAVRRALGAARRLTAGHRWALLWVYLAPFLAACVVILALLRLLIAVPGRALGAAFLCEEAIVLAWIVARMWQRASAALWYLEHAPVPVEIRARDAPVVDGAPPPPAPPDLPEPEMDLP